MAIASERQHVQIVCDYAQRLAAASCRWREPVGKVLDLPAIRTKACKAVLAAFRAGRFRKEFFHAPPVSQGGAAQQTRHAEAPAARVFTARVYPPSQTATVPFIKAVGIDSRASSGSSL